MIKLRLICTLVILALAWRGAAVFAEVKGDGSIRIGAFLCLTGNCADWGTAALKGAKLAILEVNNSGGVLGRRLELLVEDTRESISGAEAINAYQKLARIEHIRFLIGPSWSPGALAVAPLAAKNRDVLLVTPSAEAESFSQAGLNIFNIRPVERLATEAIAKYVAEHGLNRAAVLTSSQAAEAKHGRVFRETYEKLGGKIVSYIETSPETSDLRSEVAQMAATESQVIFLMAYNQMFSALKSLHAVRYEGLVAAISLDEARINAAKGMLEGALVAKAAPPSNEFVEKFKREFGEPPGLSAENGYDSVIALSKAMTAAGTPEPPLVSEKLSALTFKGATGQISFDRNRAVKQAPALYKVINGKLKLL